MKVLACIALIVAMAGAAVEAQGEAPAMRVRHVGVSGGILWSGGYPVGDAVATLRPNAPGSGAPPFTLFATASTLEAAVGAGARVGFAVTSSLALEVGLSFARPRVSVAISQDQESRAQVLEGESIEQYVVDAGALWHLPIWFGRRVRPFVSGGAGYLRQLHQERTLAETGRTYYAGAGLRYWIRGGDGTGRSIGLRGDARATWKTGGIDFERRTRVSPSLALQAFIDF